MKGVGPILLLLGGIIVLSVRNSVKNIAISIIDFKIDEGKTNVSRVVTDLKIEVTNPDRISGEIKYIFLTVKNTAGEIISTFEGPENIVFNKQTRFFLNLEMEIKTGKIIAELIEFFTGGGNAYPVQINGYIDTNLGRININEQRQLI